MKIKLEEANNYASQQEKKERSMSLEELFQFITSEDCARQCEKSHEGYDYLYDMVSDYYAHCSGEPSFESGAASGLASIARLDSYSTNSDDMKLQIKEAAAPHGISLLVTALEAFNRCNGVLPRVFPAGDYAGSEPMPVNRDVQMYIAARFYTKSIERIDYTTILCCAQQPELIYSLGGSNGALAIYNVHYDEFSKSKFELFRQKLQKKLSNANYDVFVQEGLSSSYLTWSDSKAQYNPQADIIEVEELISSAGTEALSSEESDPGFDEYGFADYDEDELAEYYEPSEADYHAKDYLEQGLLDPYPLYKNLVSTAKDESQADILLAGATTVSSSIFTKTSFVDSHEDREYYPNLTTVIVGEPATGKGVVNHLRNLLDGIQEGCNRKQKEDELRYKKEMSEYKRLEKKGTPGKYPEEPKICNYVIGGNFTGAYIVRWMQDNEGEGLILCTEYEEKAKSQNNHYGRMIGTILRQNSENEPIDSATLPTNNVRCKNPHLGSLWCGQPDLLRNLLGNGGDGMVSRAWILRITPRKVYKAVYKANEAQGKSIREVISEYKPWCTQVYNALHGRDRNLYVDFPPEFDEKLNYFIFRLQEVHQTKYGSSFLSASIMRYGTLIKRIATILTLSRQHEIDWYATQDRIEVPIDDCRFAVRIVLDRHISLLQIAHETYSDKLGVTKNGGSKYDPEKIKAELPKEFGTAEMQKVFGSIYGGNKGNIKVQCNRILKQPNAGIERIGHARYRKLW